MKATSLQTISPAATIERGWIAIYADLFKARLTFLVLLTTLVGFYLGFRGPVDYLLMLHTVLGTAMVASGAAALNQLLERRHDALMRRTQDRPLPSGELQPATVLCVGSVTAAAGIAYLGAAVNPITAVLGAASFVLYVFVYTPLKRVSWMNTLVGAIPGGLPPLMGWTAARGEITTEGLALLAILAFWQIPHFMAIAWIFRDEYARAGFEMLPKVDPAGVRTGAHAVMHTMALLFISLAPFVFGLTGRIYFIGASLLGLAFLWTAIRFAQRLDLPGARKLFFASIIYLPLLLILMVADKTSAN